MLNPSEVVQAAQVLAKRRRDGLQGERLPAACRPKDLESALAVQAQVTRELDECPGGWKCLLPSENRLVLAPIYAGDIHRAAPVSVWAPQGKAQIEPELGFVLGRDLPARDEPYSPEEVDGAIAHTHLVLELIHSRYLDPSLAEFPEMLADGLLNQGLFVGPVVDSEMAQSANELAITLHSKSAGTDYRRGHHPYTNPRAPLYWLADFLRSRGQGLKAGEVIITGSYAGVLNAPLEEPVRVQFGELGELGVSFKAKVTA